MIATDPSVLPLDDHPTLAGLTPTALHDRFWAARGVQVVRAGEPSEIVAGAELYLLTDRRLLAVFRLRNLLDQLSWSRPDVTWVRVRDRRERGYHERVVEEGAGRFARFVRDYGGGAAHLSRVGLTHNPEVARLWQQAPDARTGWRRLRQLVPRPYRLATHLPGRTYDRADADEVVQLVRDLVRIWRQPSSTIDRLQGRAPQVWADSTARIPADVEFVGPVWVGAGRELPAGATAVGPAVLWDDPAARPPVHRVRWSELEPREVFVRPVQPRQPTRLGRTLKRAFDIAASLWAILVLWPLMLLLGLIVLWDDGWPVIFAHRRETRGGKEFPCWKFRTMRRDAERIKAELLKQNVCDGPQFFLEHDPRITRSGRLLRKSKLDELPQLFNVLLGHMSVVGPRPSPRKENQFCPTWREARLSVRPGITGMWQVSRTRQPGLDFQEWIRFDLEYVERQSFGLDLWIIWRTVLGVIKGT